MSAGGQEERMLEVLCVPEELEEDLLWLFFENRRRSGGGTLESVERRGDRAVLLFAAPEDASRVLSQQTHSLCHHELRVRKPLPKDPYRLLLLGVPPTTSMEMVELYVENMLGLNDHDYILDRLPQENHILIQLHQPLSQDFQTVGSRVSRRTLDGTPVTLQQVEHTDSVLVENLPPHTCPDFLTLYFEGGRGGNQRVKEVTMLTEATAKISFNNFESVACVVDLPHSLEGVDLLVKPFFDFLVPKQPLTSVHAENVHDAGMSSEFPIECSPSMETSAGVVSQRSVELVGEEMTSETVERNGEQSHGSISILTEPSLDPCPSTQEELEQVSVMMDDDETEPVDFEENMARVVLELNPEVLRLLTRTDVKEWLLQNLEQGCVPTSYTVTPSSVVVTAPTQHAAQQACCLMEAQTCDFLVPVEAESDYVLQCREWSDFLVTLSCCSVSIQPTQHLHVCTLKHTLQDNRAAIHSFLATPIERETLIPMEAGMLKYIQTHCHHLLADMAQVSIYPLEGDDVHGLKIHGPVVACQIAEELLQGVVSSTVTSTITVNAPGVTRFLQEKECDAIFTQMETKFQVSIMLKNEPWKPLGHQDVYETAWRMMTQKNFQKVNTPEQKRDCVSRDVPDEDQLVEAKKILSAIDENQQKGEQTSDMEELDLYTADSPSAGTEELPLVVEKPPLLKNGGLSLSSELDEELQLSLAIQYSLESKHQIEEEEEQLKKTLDLSKKMTQCENVPVENRDDDTLSSLYSRAVCAANVVNLVVFAGYSSDLSRVNIAFNKKVELKQVAEKIENRSINKMSEYHWKCVEVLKRIHGVEIQVTGLILTVSGFKDFVSKAMVDVKRLVEHISASPPDKEVLRSVRWERRESASSAVTLYTADATLYLERAWKKKLDKVNIKLDHQPYVINFDRMQEINVTTGKTVGISRKELDQLDQLDQEIPEGEYSLLSSFPEASKLDVASDEFQEVVKDFYSGLNQYNSRIRIVQVEKLSNRLLFKQYTLKKASVKQNASYPEIERTLYHGTSETSVKEICTHGFNRSFCGKNATVYGQGVYFAVDSSLSIQDQYSPPNHKDYKFVLVSKVLTGDYTKGCHSMKTAPLKETGDVPLRYDSVTDDITKPTLFVIFNDTQAFPEYLITCQRIFKS